MFNWSCYAICFAISILSIIGLENKIFRCLFLNLQQKVHEKQNIKYFNHKKNNTKPFLSKWCPYWGTWGSRDLIFKFAYIWFEFWWRKNTGERDSKKKVIFAIHQCNMVVYTSMIAQNNSFLSTFFAIGF
jgi:hypothetical protein